MQKLTYEISNAEMYASGALYVFSDSYLLIIGRDGVDYDDSLRAGRSGDRIPV
jgi:hypothetical protein